MARDKAHHSILTGFAIGTMLAFVVAGTLSVLFAYVRSVMSFNEYWSMTTGQIGVLLDDLLQAGSYDELFSSADSATYKKLRQALKDCVIYYDVDCGYLYTINPERTQRTFLLSASGDEHEDALLRSERSLGAVSTAPINAAELRALNGEETNWPDVSDNEFGRHFCWYRRIELPDNKGHAIIGIDQDMSVYYDFIDRDIWHFATLMFLLLVCIAAAEIILLKRNVVTPIQEVTSHMRAFAVDGFAKDRLQIKRRDEIGEIALTFNQMTMDIEQSVRKIEEMTEERVATLTELQVAKRIQQGQVPASKSVAGAGYEVYASARTARIVGGDFYDVMELDDGRVALVNADVSGKGISAALFMSMFMTLLREKLEKKKDPAQALNEANDVVVNNNPENMFATVIAAIFDPVTGILTFANAGHMPPLVVGSGFLQPDPGIALGLFEDAGIVNETLVLNPGDGIVFYTDGTTETNNPQHQFFGEERLLQAVEDVHGAQDAVETIVRAVDAFTGEAEQFDDLTLVSLFALERDVCVWKATVEPQLAALAEVRQHLEEFCDGDNGLFKRVMLACDEGFTNVTSYSGATFVEFEITRIDGQLVVCMTDDGMPFDPLTYESADLEFEDLEFGGMGISFIKQSCDEVAYAYEDGKNVLRMTFFL